MPTSRPGKYDRNNPNTGPPQPSDYRSRKDYDAAEIDMFHLTCERLLGEDRYSDLVKADPPQEEPRSPEPAPPKVIWKPRWPSEDTRETPSMRQSDASAPSSPQSRSTPPLSTSTSSPMHSSEHERAKSEDVRPGLNESESYSSNPRPQSVLSVASLLSTDGQSVPDQRAVRQSSSETQLPPSKQNHFPTHSPAVDSSAHERNTSDHWT